MSKYFCYLLLLVAVVILSPRLKAQWISLEDQTSNRFILNSFPYNDAEEKDIAVGDLNRDGWTDVVVVRKQPFSSQGPEADILLLNVRGKLVDYTKDYAPEFISNPSDSRDVLIIDIDGNNWLDVIVCNTFEQQPILYYNLGNNSEGEWLGFQDESSTRLPILTINPLQFCAVWGGDVTGNDVPDLYFSNYNPGNACDDVLLINDGNGVFTDESDIRLGILRKSAFGTSVEIHDVDNDGDNDIIKISTLFHVPPWNDNGVFILFNEGGGTFTQWQKILGDKPYMFTIGDLTNDFKRDVYTVDDDQDYVNIATNLRADTLVEYNYSELTNSPRTAGFGGNCKMIDIDNDGDLDIGIASVDVDIPPCESGGLRKFALLRNQDVGSGTLMDPWGTSSNPWNQSAHDFGFLDINRDGRIDIFLGLCSSYAIFMQEPLDSPINLTSDGKDALVNLSWSPNTESDISSYNIYRSTTEDVLTADSIASVNHPDTTYSDSNVLNDTTYYYWLTAVDSDDNESYYSIPDSATPQQIIPVELTSFSGTPYNNMVKLEWETATELNNYGFHILRRGESDEWVVLGFIPGHGTSTEPQNYFYNDESVSSGYNFYRLKQTDFDGTFSFSEEIEIEVTVPLEFKLFQSFPNPFNPETSISFTIPEEQHTTLKVYDVLGNEIIILLNKVLEPGKYSVTFNGTDLPSGTYFYKLQSGKFTGVKKMILIK